MGIAERRKREKEQRREDILNAAERLFFSRSFEEVSMDKIAQEVELNKATLYLYFKNKEDLYATIVLRGIEILKEKFTQCMDTDAPGIVKVALMGQAYYQFSQEYPDYLRMIHFYGTERFSKENPCNADIGKGYGVCRLILRDAVQQGIDDGTIKTDLDPFLTSMYLMISFMNNLSMETKWKLVIEAEGFRFNHYTREVFRFIIPSIISREQSSKLDIRDFAKYGFRLFEDMTVQKI
jgi:TetR/AcrR family transcriptional regulator